MTRAAWYRVKAGLAVLGVMALAGCNRGEGVEDTAAGRPADTSTAAAGRVTDDTASRLPDDPAPDTGRASRAGTRPDAGTPPAGSPPHPSPVAGRDTARGIVRRIGSEPGDVLVLEGPSGEMLALVGTGAGLVREVEGLEVAVEGRLTRERLTAAAPHPIRGFDVEEFSVRAMDGREAYDGTLAARSGRYYLKTTAGGEIPVLSPPAALLEHVGARVWIVGPRGEPPRTFGVIRH